MTRMRDAGTVACLVLLGLWGCGAEVPPADSPPLAQRTMAEEEDRSAPCQPTAGGPHWLEEGALLQVQVSCASGEPLDGNHFHLKELPPGAHYDKKTATLSWRPRLDQAGVYTLELEGPKKELGWVKVGVADRWSAPDNVPVGDPRRYPEEFGLPVLHLTSSTVLDPDAYAPVTVTYRGHVYTAEAKVRGSSSLSFPKNSYTVKFTAEDPFQEPSLGGGFTGRRSLVLVNTFNDNSYLRARLGFELWSRLSPEAVPVSTFSAVVFLNGAYHGLYTVADHVNARHLAAHGLSEQSNLYRADKGSANFRLVDSSGAPKRHPHVGFEKKEGLPLEGEPGAFEDLDAFVTFVATASDEAFRTQGPMLFRQRDYEDWWAFITLLVALDSDVKNAYHAHDPSGGPWRYIPWDLDGTFGQTWKTQRLRPTAALDTGTDNELFRRLLAEPTFAVPLRARLRASLTQELAVPLMQARLDALAQELGPSARRDEARWQSQYRAFPLWSARTDFTTFDEEVAYIRQWISLRWAFLDVQLAASP